MLDERLNGFEKRLDSFEMRLGAFGTQLGKMEVRIVARLEAKKSVGAIAALASMFR